ncbi:hypothetical protein V5S96_04945 [Corynebacterium mastitidis]|uniref:Uncharacterized protein n=1 Tax=Corynebacterium mastitidis TaxID=161890 RepID=A0ABU8P0C0_9CORY
MPTSTRGRLLMVLASWLIAFLTSLLVMDGNFGQAFLSPLTMLMGFLSVGTASAIVVQARNQGQSERPEA